MSRELTRKEKTAIRSLVVTWCANYDREYGCLPLDSDCYMLGKCWTGSYCRYFRESVLPLDPALEASLMSEGPRPDFKICPVCGGAVAPDRRQAFRWPAVSFYGMAPFAPMLSTSIQRDFGTICPEVPAF